MTLKYFSVLTDYSNQPNLIISNLLSQRYLLLQKKKKKVLGQVPTEDFSLHSIAMSLKSPFIQNSRSAVFVFHNFDIFKNTSQVFWKGFIDLRVSAIFLWRGEGSAGIIPQE